MTETADDAHFEGFESQYFGEKFEFAGYDTKHDLYPLVFAHHVGLNCRKTWTTVIEACSKFTVFYFEGRSTSMDEDKSIESVYSTTLLQAKFYPVHIKKNMENILREEHGSGKCYIMALYRLHLKM